MSNSGVQAIFQCQGTHRQDHEPRGCRDHQGPNLRERLPYSLPGGKPHPKKKPKQVVVVVWRFWSMKTGHFTNKNHGIIGFHGHLVGVFYWRQRRKDAGFTITWDLMRARWGVPLTKGDGSGFKFGTFKKSIKWTYWGTLYKKRDGETKQETFINTVFTCFHHRVASTSRRLYIDSQARQRVLNHSYS